MMLFADTAAGFDDPLGLLAACHRRMESFCTTLEKLEAHVDAFGADDEARTAARRVLEYFDRAAPQHHADEEIDLLPLLEYRADTGETRAAVAAWAARTADEHGGQIVAWHRLREALVALTEKRAADPLAPSVFVSAVRSHYRFEDTEVFPLANALLTPSDLVRLGHCMAERRGRALTEQDRWRA
ncbi:hypothetical protein BJI67_10410 [Acidihalobacter aeolianus]|uniref:Hemerythrin-like domain-containing protein n=1 Tax=Acidihalobacter aeolianus TaxID=2792603 RepID=A0A1D8K8Z7_9GAMM|nr:hemerythrin domain-containing protein [Acidihalobacter aeolianus]AOV17416.1 hypothetical protein BJI67_10410 [Acidihalobacter aeolianus]